MAFFSVFAILDKENKYKQLTQQICRHRQKLLYEGLGIKFEREENDASYYTEFDLLQWAHCNYGEDFSAYLEKNYKPVDILLRLAEKSSIVLLGGGGFHGPEWSIRISLANLNDEAYSKIGKVLHNVLDEYVKEWKCYRDLQNKLLF